MKPTFTLQIAKIVGTPSDGFWSQVHTFSPEEEGKKEKRGDLLTVLVITGVPAGVESVAAGREILSRLHQEYYENLSGSAFERLSTAVKRLGEENENLELIAAVLLNQALYLTIYGDGRIFLKRGEKAGILLKGDGGLKTASGLLEANDLLVLGSQRFFEAVGDGVLKASLESGSATEAVETLAPIVLGRSDMSAAAAILACARKEEELSIQPVMPEEEKSVASPVPVKEGKSVLALPLKEKFLGSLRLKFLHRRRSSIFVRSAAAERKKRLYFLISLVLLFLLGTSLILGVHRKAETDKRAQAGQLVKQAEEKLNQGKTLFASQPSEGRVLGEEAQRLTEEALTLSPEGNEEATFLKEEVKKFLSSLGREVALAEPAVFMDLNIIDDEASGVALGLAEENLVVLDKTKKKIYLLSVEKRSQTVIDLAGEQGNLLVAVDKKAFVLAEDGIYAVNLLQKSASLKVEKDEAWQEIVGLGTFVGNLYLLDKGAGNIWRYLATDEGFGVRKSWFLGAPPDLSQSVSLAVDGVIWVLKKEGISKFNLGKEENFVLNRMPESFLDPAKIFTSAEAENLYVLDKGRGKIYVIAKNGDFKAAYAWDGFKNAQDLVAVESLKKLFVLSGTKIYTIDLK
ncbi:MAG TPA: hypothetical protein VMW04_03135 [Patescibacteria group bacterium]|nr:hypothetical protein [Patescibacteria group bacterium]